MAYPETGSTLDWSNGNNRTSTSLSTHILVKVGGQAIGAIRSISVKESRDITMVNEVGTDGSIDSAPNKSSTFSGSISRVRFDGLRGATAFGRIFTHVQSQQYPFDIEIIDRQHQDSKNWITTTLKNVWFTDINYSYKSDDWIVMDEISYKCETIYSVGPGGPAANGGARNLKLNVNTVEARTDMGQRRGSMDASGLFDVGQTLIWTP